MDANLTLPSELQEAAQAEAEAHGFDEAATRWLALLLQDDATLPAPTAGAMVARVRELPIGAYLAAEIPDHGEVVTAALSLVPCAYWYTDQDPLPSPTMTLHLGTWPGFLADRQTLWGAWDSGVVLGEFDTADILGLDCYAGETQRTLIPLNPAHIHPGQTLKLALRDAEDHVDLRPAHNYENRVFGAYDLGGQVWLEIGFGESGG